MNENSQTQDSDPLAIDRAIQMRRTEKVLSLEPVYPRSSQFESMNEADEDMRQTVAISGWAPFHYDRNLDGVSEPWRMQLLFHESCRQLSSEFTQLIPDLKPGNKLPGMLNACGALVLVHCVTQEKLDDAGKLEQVNREHHAATSAAVQNLLLALTARGYGTYWSSGGPLGSTAVQQRFGIPSDQSRLLSLVAAVFVDYPFLTENRDVQRIEGKNRSRRSPANQWSTEIKLPK